MSCEVVAVFLQEESLNHLRLVMRRRLIEALVKLQILTVAARALIRVKNWRHIISGARRPYVHTHTGRDCLRLRDRIRPGSLHPCKAVAVLTIHLYRAVWAGKIGAQMRVVVQLDLGRIAGALPQNCELRMLLVEA